MINEIKEIDEETGKIISKGYSCTVGYTVIDENGDIINTGSESHKYTSGTTFSDILKLSEDSDKLVTDFVNAISINMNARENIN